MRRTETLLTTGAAAWRQPVERIAELSAAQQVRMIRALTARLARDGAPDGTPPRHVETHISHVLLHAGHAYKVKKVLTTPFLDQSTLARRRFACAEEVRLNRRLAPRTYLDVVDITGTVDAPALGGGDPVLDVAVRMRAFDEDALWDRLAERRALRDDDIDDLAATLARFHGVAGIATLDGGFGAPTQVRPALLDSLRDLRAGLRGGDGPDAAAIGIVGRLQQWEAEVFPALEASMARRLAAGRVREGHGDLHLGNVARDAGHALAFDGIEFDAGLRWIDVMSDVAFMTMDLHAHDLPALAHRFVDTYLQHSGDYDGMGVLGYYLVHRALVRAKVALLRATQAAAAGQDASLRSVRRYLDLARRLTLPRPRALLITHGLSGSGKTTLTQGLLERLGAPRVRSDIERKRLAGLAPLQASHSAPAGGIYVPAMNDATQQRLLAAAGSVLAAGWPVILDATFLRRADRDAARRCAGEFGVPFFILDFQAPPETLALRLRQRALTTRDASEADQTVLEMQARMQDALGPDECGEVHRVHAASTGAPNAPVDWTGLFARIDAAAAGGTWARAT